MKTWEMLRDIKPGDVWKADNNTSNLVKISDELYWQSGDYRDIVFLDSDFLDAEWTEVPNLVDFVEAWKSFEEGRVIRSDASNNYYVKNNEGDCLLLEREIRGKWEIIELG